LFGYSRQAYYKQKQVRLKRRDELIQVRELISRIRSKMPRLGTRKLYYLIKEKLVMLGIKLGRDMLFSFLRAEHLLIKPLKKFVLTTNSRHWMRKYPNCIKQLVLTRPEQLWVSDITYIKTSDGNTYLSLVTDAYSKKIMGYELLDTLSAQGPLNALLMAINNRKYNQQLIHHSDRGLQYCSSEYIGKLNEHQIQISMTENGDPYENAVAERVNGILKNEFLFVRELKNQCQVLKLIKDAVQIYNEYRPHLSCQLLTPNQSHKQSHIRVKKWHRNTQKQLSF
jgi:putative transposase